MYPNVLPNIFYIYPQNQAVLYQYVRPLNNGQFLIWVQNQTTGPLNSNHSILVYLCPNVDKGAPLKW